LLLFLLSTTTFATSSTDKPFPYSLATSFISKIFNNMLTITFIIYTDIT